MPNCVGIVFCCLWLLLLQNSCFLFPVAFEIRAIAA